MIFIYGRHSPTISPPRQSTVISTPRPASNSAFITSARDSFEVFTIRSAFKCAIDFASSSFNTVVITLAPTLFAIGINTLARPLAPACISNVSPAFNPPSINKNKYAAAYTSGIAAASAIDNPFGIGINKPSGTAAYSAYPPPPKSAHTRSPTCHFPSASTSLPTALIIPADSNPNQSGHPGGGGYCPALWSKSARLIPAAYTSSKTSSSFICGSGTSDQCRCPSFPFKTAYM